MKEEQNKKTKNLLYIECQNCGENFDTKKSFIHKQTTFGTNQFTCTACRKTFNYPTYRKSWGYIAIGLILCIFSITTGFSPKGLLWDPLRTGIVAGIGIIGFALLLQGAISSIQNSDLKDKYPNWENRLHNTQYNKNED